MRSSPSTGPFAALMVLSAVAHAAEPKAAPLLDGRTFAIEMTEMGAKAGQADSLIFKEGKFYSTGCEAWGFGWGTYAVKAEGSLLHWEAATASPVEGTMRWKGTVKGERIEGAVVWSKAGQRDIEYIFKGALKKKA